MENKYPFDTLIVLSTISVHLTFQQYQDISGYLARLQKSSLKKIDNKNGNICNPGTQSGVYCHARFLSVNAVVAVDNKAVCQNHKVTSRPTNSSDILICKTQSTGNQLTQTSPGCVCVLAH